VFLCGCHPKKNSEPEAPAETAPVSTPVATEQCRDLPPAPPNFGWTDSTVDVYENVVAFMGSPLDNDEIVCVVEGNINGFNQIFTYNVKTQQKKVLGNAGPFLPSINKNGWVVYSTADNNIYRIKANGDSLQQLTNNLASMAPKWDYSGTAIIYFQEATIGTPASSMVKLKFGSSNNNYVYPTSLPHHASFNKKDKVLFLKSSNTTVTIIERDLVSQTERLLISGPYEPQSGKVHFNHLCVDANDEFFFWSNSLGIFRCNLTSLNVDTLFKNCPASEYLNPITLPNSFELNISNHTKTPINNSVLFHQYKPLQVNLTSMIKTEIRIFP
jgi:hypothetical protein